MQHGFNPFVLTESCTALGAVREVLTRFAGGQLQGVEVASYGCRSRREPAP